MPVYEYKALNPSGRETRGTIDSENIRVARQKLRSQRIYPTEIKEGKTSIEEQTRDVKRLFGSNRVSLKILSISTRQLATLVAAGIPLVDSLQGVAEQTESAPLRRTLVDVRERVEEGSSLHRALASYPKIFPKLYINMVASGEASGTLDTVYENLADYLETQLELRRKITTALFYPVLMLCFCSLVVIGLLTYVVPSIVEIFEKNNAVLPLPTRIMIGISHLLTSGWYLMILFAILMVYLFRMYYAQAAGRSRVDLLAMKVPIFGKLYQKVYTARVAQTLGALLQSGVGLLTALEIVRNIVGNVHVVKAIEEARDGVREGRSLAREFAKSGLFPPMLPQMISVGEKSGRLEMMLGKAGQAYTKEVNASLQGLTALIEPLMIIVVGIIVLCIVASILLPMTSLMDALQK